MSVHDTFARLADAWNAGDGHAYGAAFTPDATYVTFEGQVLRGREEIDRVHRFLFDGPLRGSRMEPAGDDAEVREIAPGVAVAVSGGAVVPPGQDRAGPDRASVQTFVLVRDDGTGGDSWLVAAFHNVRRA